MKPRILVGACGLLLALTAIPSQLRADSFCSDPPPYQWQQCGTIAKSNLFTVNASGLSNGVFGTFGGYHADFPSDVFAIVWRDGQQVYTGSPSPKNTQLSIFQGFSLVPSGVLQAGDQIEFVVDVADVNGEQLYYSMQLGNNLDGQNHLWAESLAENQCDPNQSGNCLFLGWEDLPIQEGSDEDFNDFKFFLYGADISSSSAAVPEPSSILLLTGAPLAFAGRRLRRLF